MTFIITLIALVIERFFDWSHLRQWRWFPRYQALLSARIATWPVMAQLAANVLPLMLAVGLVDCIIKDWLFGVLKLVFGIFVLVYCLGLKNFWAEVYAAIADLHKDDAAAAMEKIQKTFGIRFPAEPQAFHRAFTSALFVEAYHRVFAVLFWYMLLGPMGAVMYRVVDLCKTRGTFAVSEAAKFQVALDWLPVRVFTFVFALGGHFTSVIAKWKTLVGTKSDVNEQMLTDCGIAALDVLEAERIPEDGTAEKETLALLDRVFVMTLVLLAFVVLLV